MSRFIMKSKRRIGTNEFETSRTFFKNVVINKELCTVLSECDEVVGRKKKVKLMKKRVQQHTAECAGMKYTIYIQ